MSQLQQIEIGTQRLPRRVLLYGVLGVGCSTFAAGADRPLFIPTEHGLHHIDCHRVSRCSRFDSVMEALRQLHSHPRGYKTVVIDPLEGLENLIRDEVCRDRGLESIEELSFGRGYGLAMTYWRRMLRGLEALQRDCGMTVMLVGHAQIERYDASHPVHCRRYVPAVHWRTCLLLQSWCDEVLFATYDWDRHALPRPVVQDACDGLRTGPSRVIYTSPTAFCVAKNHLGLPARIPMDYRELTPCLSASRPGITHQN